MITISSLADLLKQDVYRRGLKPGDSYLTTAEAARFLGVSTSMANRTLQLLKKQNVLKRSQRRGSLVATPANEHFHRAPTKVKLLLNENIYRHHPTLYDGIMTGLERTMGIPRPECIGLSAKRETEIVDGLIAEILASNEAVAFILAGVPLLVQRHIVNSGLPAAVLGTLHPSIKGLLAVDRDPVSSSKVAMQYLQEQGCRHVALLFFSRIFPGNCYFSDGIMAEMSRLGMPASALTFRALPLDLKACEAEAKKLIERVGEKIGFISNPPIFAEAINRVAAGMKTMDRPVVCINDPSLDPELSRRFPRIELAITHEEIGEKLAACLLSFSNGAPLEAADYLLPTKLVLPDGNS